jgi:hypothetical protein
MNISALLHHIEKGRTAKTYAAMTSSLSLCLGLLVASLVFADGRPPTPSELNSPTIGYRTVAEALASLKLLKDASFSVAGGWTIVTDEPHLTVWSFSPKTDPSYPSVVKRMVTSTGSGSKVTTNVLCEAAKSACDNLVREFSNAKGSR